MEVDVKESDEKKVKQWKEIVESERILGKQQLKVKNFCLSCAPTTYLVTDGKKYQAMLRSMIDVILSAKICNQQ